MSTKRTKIFLDMEFTGLHKLTTPVSIALVAANGKEYYAEFTDYDKLQVDNFLRELVLPKRILTEYNFEADYNPDDDTVLVKGDIELVKETLTAWLEQFKETGVEIWGDTLAYDWVLFVSIFGNAFDVPKHIFYIPFDIATALKCFGEDPDVTREEFAYTKEELEKLKNNTHNALFDARTQLAVFKKLLQKGEKKDVKPKKDEPAKEIEKTTEEPKQIEEKAESNEVVAEEVTAEVIEEETDTPETDKTKEKEEDAEETDTPQKAHFVEPSAEDIHSTEEFNPPL